MAIVLGALLLMLAISACGTIEVGLADESIEDSVLTSNDQDDTFNTEEPRPTATATDSPLVEPLTSPTPPVGSTGAPPTATTTAQGAPVGWQRFSDLEYGLELWHPPGTTAVIGEPSRPTFSSPEFPDGIVEEQEFVVRIVQEEGGPFGPPGPLAILEVKVVANPLERTVAEMADLFSKRCPGSVADPIKPTTINPQLSGYRYGCEGMDGIIFNELWAPHPNGPGLLIGAAWADMSAPLSDEILATLSFS
jgi:hypothetical protein